MIESVGLQDGDLRQAQPCFQAFGRPDEAWLLKGEYRSMWERACSRKRRVSQHSFQLTERLREQARSHRFYGKSVFLFVVRHRQIVQMPTGQRQKARGRPDVFVQWIAFFIGGDHGRAFDVREASFQFFQRGADQVAEQFFGMPPGVHLDECGQPCGSCLLYTSPSPRDGLLSRMPSSA